MSQKTIMQFFIGSWVINHSVGLYVLDPDSGEPVFDTPKQIVRCVVLILTRYLKVFVANCIKSSS